MRKTVLRPKTVYRAHSALSGRIEVRDSGRERVLEINGQVHSVYYKRGDWKGAALEYWGLLAAPPFPLPPDPDVFMLGLGGATAVRLLCRTLRPASIVVAEADPGIVSVAREYFDTGSLPGLEVVTGDGHDVMRTLRDRGRTFDLLIDDVYFDATSILSGPGRGLFEAMASIARPGATIVLNRPVDRREQEAVNASLADELRRTGAPVEARSVRGAYWNDIIYYRHRGW
jgi:spermidine synthase